MFGLGKGGHVGAGGRRAPKAERLDDGHVKWPLPAIPAFNSCDETPVIKSPLYFFSTRSILSMVRKITFLMVGVAIFGCDGTDSSWRKLEEVPPQSFDLDQALKGKVVRLPEKDVFGHTLPSGAKIVVAMPSCESCAAKSVTTYRSNLMIANMPVILCYPDSEKVVRKRINPVPSSYVISDLRQKKVPDMAYLFCPRALRVNDKDVIEAHLDLDAKPEDWRRWAK